jgi:hypothetical protein
MKTSRVCLVCITALWTCLAQSDEDFVHKNAGSSVFSFLRMSYESRSLGMARIGIGMPNDLYGALSNPAALAYIDNMQAFASYRPIALDIRSGAAGAGRRFGQKGFWAASAAYLSFGEVREVDENNELTGDVWKHQALTGAVSWAAQVAPAMGFGASLKGVYDRMAGDEQGYSADGIAFDIGWQYRLYSSRLIIGLLLRNTGFIRAGYTDDDPAWSFPWSIGAGLSYIPLAIPRLRLAMDLEKSRDDYLNYRLGSEVRIYKNYLIGRAGVQFSHRDLRHLGGVLQSTASDFYQKTNWSIFDLGLGIVAPVEDYEIRIDAGLNIRTDGLPASPSITLLANF